VSYCKLHHEHMTSSMVKGYDSVTHLATYAANSTIHTKSAVHWLLACCIPAHVTILQSVIGLAAVH